MKSRKAIELVIEAYAIKPTSLHDVKREQAMSSFTWKLTSVMFVITSS
jgi:hypothetical protein